MNLYKAREDGEEAARLIQSEAWKTAWVAYRDRILAEIEAEPVGSPRIHQLHTLLSAGRMAKGHLELAMKQGKLSDHFIFDEEKKKRFKLF